MKLKNLLIVSMFLSCTRQIAICIAFFICIESTMIGISVDTFVCYMRSGSIFLPDIRVFAISSLKGNISQLSVLLSALEIPENKFAVLFIVQTFGVCVTTVGRSRPQQWLSSQFLLFVEHELLGDPVHPMDQVFLMRKLSENR